jgi:CheY-like chemotaxis protein
MMRSMLEKLGWSVSEAENGRLALQQVAQKRPALILLDLVMPEMDGFEFASELHRNTEWQSIPIVVLTGKDLTAEELTLLNGNVQNVIDKGDSSQEEMMLQVRDLIVGLTNSSNRINVPQSSETAREKGVKANA